jgi:hypothetical protein
MSEDIDLRIVSDKPPGRGAPRRLRDAITQALLSAGFKFDPRDPAYRKSGNESRYMIYRLPYEPAATGEGALRPTIQIEMAADKFVGLKRRAGAEIAGLDEPDSALVRRLHDLHALREHYDPANVVALAREVMLAEPEAHGNQFPAYRDNPMRETVRAVEGLVAEPDYARQYAEFLRLMVYGSAAEFAACAAALQNLAMRLTNRSRG